MSAKKQRTPQEKKKLSYEKDRRNTYGESRVSSVKSIKRRKRGANRVFRRGNKRVAQLSVVSIESDTDEKAIRELGKMKMKKKRWRKSPDTPLGEYIERQKEKAVSRINRKSEKKKRNGLK